MKTITIRHTGTGGDVRVRADSESPARDAANILARRPGESAHRRTDADNKGNAQHRGGMKP